MSLFAELKRRNVFRVGVAYVICAWVIAPGLRPPGVCSAPITGARGGRNKTVPGPTATVVALQGVEPTRSPTRPAALRR
jgi:hypothetical protein